MFQPDNDPKHSIKPVLELIKQTHINGLLKALTSALWKICGLCLNAVSMPEELSNIQKNYAGSLLMASKSFWLRCNLLRNIKQNIQSVYVYIWALYYTFDPVWIIKNSRINTNMCSRFLFFTLIKDVCCTILPLWKNNNLKKSLKAQHYPDTHAQCMWTFDHNCMSVCQQI